MAKLGRDVIVIGASAGGIEAVLKVASALPPDLPAAVFVAVHLAAGYASSLPELLSERGPLRAIHPVDGEAPKPGVIYVAPPDNHLMLRGPFISVARGPKENGHRPSIDALFRSAAATFGPRVIGVVLTGNLDCGTAGLLSIKARGGVAVVQDPREAAAPSMPASAVSKVAVDHVVGLAQLPALLDRLTREPASVAPPGFPGAILELEGEHPGAPTVLVCPACQGVLSESQLGDYVSFHCHVGHSFSLAAVVAAQAETVERALWSAVRALEETAALTRRLADAARGELRRRFEEKEQDHRLQADTIKRLLMSPDSLDSSDAEVLLAPAGCVADE